MADITMCLKSDCPSFNECYRAQAEKDEINQFYTRFDNAGKSCCDYYIPVEPSWKNKFPCL